MFTGYEIRIANEYAGAWGKSPPGFKLLQEVNLCQRINDAILARSVDNFEGSDHMMARIHILFEKESPLMDIIEIELNAKKYNYEIGGCLCEKLQVMINRVKEGEFKSYPYRDYHEFIGVGVESSMRLIVQRRVDELQLVSGGRFVVVVTSTECSDNTAVILDEVIRILAEMDMPSRDTVSLPEKCTGLTVDSILELVVDIRHILRKAYKNPLIYTYEIYWYDEDEKVFHRIFRCDDACIDGCLFEGTKVSYRYRWIRDEITNIFNTATADGIVRDSEEALRSLAEEHPSTNIRKFGCLSAQLAIPNPVKIAFQYASNESLDDKSDIVHAICAAMSFDETKVSGNYND